jgi:hypothetical protein
LCRKSELRRDMHIVCKFETRCPADCLVCSHESRMPARQLVRYQVYVVDNVSP